ncbi:CDC48 family AAA ATPase [Geotalea uraniireducens]|uniref:AAA family ATPase, CDC48 subfamily n=1 Tax=Geotalea uraniireducens (strain Rf4) TaxID=351605 RepID=A5G5E7_GEOUR|nr:CDC48 family AAA ATPase [Geotalea uraniireducens]ABQ27015.1 AAA family ATPase, CDC48 subfamily [Geotalea uraniireducens Rf4]
MSEISLKVTEALPKDVGRGIARIDPEVLTKLEVEIGDVVEITGKKPTVARVMPVFRDLRGKGLIQVDGLTRSNASTAIGEKVHIKKVACKAANKVVLSPVVTGMAGRDSKFVGRLLEGLPIVSGDRVRATVFGSRYQDFTVADTIPTGAVMINPQTLIRIEEKGAKLTKARVSYEDIGGLGKGIQKVREMIELPLRHPQIFEKLGIDPPKGLLLHGPPGTGKTLIARAVANETNASFYSVSGPEIIHKFYGESEAKLRNLFEEARKNAPSIIFLDEIDAIAPKREQVTGEVEKRVVAQLLALMDGLAERGQVIVIGATNIPNALDQALRRPGRFDRELEIGIPDVNGRMEILDIHTRGMPLTDDVNLLKLAQVTHGFVGADLEALCREAAMNSIRRIIPKIEFELEQIPYELLQELNVTMEDFMRAQGEIEPTAMREFFVDIPNVTWDEVGGLQNVKKELNEAVVWPLVHADLYEFAKVKPPKGILLYGPPGTGKTLLAKALATESKVNFISIKGPALMSKYVGESERSIREVFKRARQSAPCILFFDEMDAIAPARGGGGDSHVSERVISQLLTEIDGTEELKGVFILGATNRKDIIDPALLRPGRIDILVEIPPPGEDARLEIFKVHTRGKPLLKDVDLKSIAAETEGLVGADIEFLCRKATIIAICEFVEKGADDPKTLKISAAHFQEAMKVFMEGRR